MKSAAFDYIAAKSVAEATAALAVDKASALAIAGGQSLVPMLNLRVAMPDLLVDIGRLSELKETCATATSIRIGALTTHAEIEDGKVPSSFEGLLPQVASGISYRAIRHHGTIGGSIALADPAADWPVCLTALGAVVRIAGCKGTRSQPIGDFIEGQYTTSLAKDELIIGFDIPRPDARLRWGCYKVVRKSGGYANSIAVIVACGSGGPVSVVLGSAGPRPLQLPAVADCVRIGSTSENMLRATIMKDLKDQAPDCDPYLTRLHTSTVLRAVREMPGQ